jgi:hypothetical protein
MGFRSCLRCCSYVAGASASRAEPTRPATRSSRPGSDRWRAPCTLSDLRCDGSGHGGCQASCLLFWKNAWLRPTDESSAAGDRTATENRGALKACSDAARAMEILVAATRGSEAAANEATFSCQATELRAATSALRWWNVRQYAQDLDSRNVSRGRFARGFLVLLLNKFQAANRRYMPRLTLISGGRRYPFVAGTLDGKTPEENLNLQPGELVRIKSKRRDRKDA